MTSLPAITSRRLIAALQRAGYNVHHTTGSHVVLKHPARPAVRVVVPQHSGDMKRGTLHNILRQAELTVDALTKLL